MPRQSVLSPSSKKRKTWDPDQMKKAIEAVRTKVMGYKKAAKIFSVPRSTLPQDIQPIPRAKTRTSNRGRKATTTKVITSSPYKNQLIESLSLAETRGRRRGRGRGLGHSQDGEGSGSSTIQRVITSSSSSESDAVVETDSEYDDNVYPNSVPESSDTICIFCDTSYLNDRPGEEWIQCQSCHLWAHTACAGPEGEYYICEFCR